MGIAEDVINWLRRNFIRGDKVNQVTLRSIKLLIENGTVADSIKCTITSEFNGGSSGPTDDITKGATVGNFTLSADGSVLTLENAWLGKTILSILSVDIGTDTGFAETIINRTVTNGDIVLSFIDSTAAIIDLPTQLDPGEVTIVYITFLSL